MMGLINTPPAVKPMDEDAGLHIKSCQGAPVLQHHVHSLIRLMDLFGHSLLKGPESWIAISGFRSSFLQAPLHAL